MLKSSITLFETMISLLILMVVVGGFLKIPYDSYEDEELFNLINELENNFATKDYRYFLKQKGFLTIIKDSDDKQKEIISVDKYIFKNDKITVFKYEK
ncbi:hypothetical protein CRU87_08070 [Aliarcobacter trophiarum LMG 25534]|uniref:Prepilin-type cleavage/methylation domain-containing protein n=1 Tax=Aliarcobacter trophiarum LMG 25534 TaxID=1032241 RepID=A0ABY0EUV8_9BACT|nr:hypothetical protein [Aliarcobacter trophiarum]RXI27625.1 hypothetical protein CRU89_04945 [Aliarcobacter trophiarum]RXJ89933.1 hypothetical protein CRU87_08070 [Aliarcobacter trophiarum LMG 25534]